MKNRIIFILYFLFYTIVIRAEGGKINGIHYILDDSNMTASVVSMRDERHKHNNYKGKIIIPYTVKHKGNNYAVTEIKDDAFSYCYQLTEITIPHSVKRIGKYAFQECYALHNITLPNSLEEIGDGAFYHCVNINTIHINSNVRKIGDHAFSNGVKNLTISVNNTNYCFSDGILYDKNKTKLIECIDNKKGKYIILDSVKEIGEGAFWGCNGLTSVIIPNSLTTIGSSAFRKCAGLKSITIPQNVISIGYSAFDECNQLTRVIIDSDSFMKYNRSGRSTMDCLVGIFGPQVKEYIIGEHVTAIGDYTFWRCNNMTSVIIGDNVTSIGYAAFLSCTGLTSVVVPENLTTLGKGATFQSCTSLKKVQWDAQNCTLELYDDGKFQPPFSGSTSITEFYFGAKVKVIPECLCFNIKSLTSITIPSSVTSIKESAFRKCSSLSSINISNSVNEMGCCVFEDCINLVSITLPNLLKHLYKTTFKGCTRLETIVYPRGLDVSKLEILSTTKLVAYNVETPNPTHPTPIRKIPLLKWTNFQSISQQRNYSFKVGVKSDSKIEEVKVYVNNNIERGIFPVLNDGYDMTISKNITLAEGRNIIKIVVKNADGESASERVVTYIEKKASPNNHQQRRIALVMGNANYMDVDKSLKNPTNDASDMAAKLESLGFTVIRSLDQTQLGMEKAINDFGEQIKNYDAALFYYAGHGMRSDGYNYLVPVDANLPEESFVRYKCINANMILDIMEKARCPMKIIILDACRNNPFARTWNRGMANEGLGIMAAPKGTFVAFSTAPGEVAKDGIGRNSPYTAAILQTLDIPNLSLMDFFQEVLEKVSTATGNSQTPWMSGSFRGKFYFNQK